MKSLFLDSVYYFNWFVLVYFFILNLGYLIFLLISQKAMHEYNSEYKITQGIELPKQFYKPFSILVPAYNEEKTIVDSVRSLLKLSYPEYEIIVVNDGSTDSTLEQLHKSYELIKVDVSLTNHFQSKEIKGIYYSRTEPKLVVMDKYNGGKSDAYNAGTNAAKYPYICSVDADSVLSRDSMFKLMQKFIVSPFIVGVGGIVRLANGCRFSHGEVTQVRMPKRILEKIQVVEYLRAFLFGRLGWSRINILMIISGAFGVFRKDILKSLQGWNSDSVVEDMELVLRMQRMFYEKKNNYCLSFAPDPICWTQAPNSLKGLSSQRDRWQRGLMDTMIKNLNMLFNIRYKRIGLIGYPYFFFFEFLGVFVEVIGYCVVIASFAFGIVDIHFLLLFLAVAILWGMFISYVSIALEERTYHRYSGISDLVWMFIVVILENFGYRQIHSFWRFKGMVKYMLGRSSGWGTIKRTSFEN